MQSLELLYQTSLIAVALILTHKAMKLCFTMRTSILLKIEFSAWEFIKRDLTWPFYLMLMPKSIQSRQFMVS